MATSRHWTTEQDGEVNIKVGAATESFNCAPASDVFYVCFVFGTEDVYRSSCCGAKDSHGGMFPACCLRRNSTLS